MNGSSGLGGSGLLREDETEEKAREAGVQSYFTPKPKRRWARGQSQDLALAEAREDEVRWLS